jgi:hypothetical protein
VKSEVVIVFSISVVVVAVAVEIFSQLSVATNCEAVRTPMTTADDDIACKKAGVLLSMVCHPLNS